jgi:signal transduction histidine kinase
VTTSPVLVPHAVCWAASPGLIWTMVVANAVTFLSYVSICLTLLLIGRRTFRVMARDWIWFVVGFALFIVACGTTHLMDVVTTWIPVFWLGAWAVIVTAVLSAYVAVALIYRARNVSFGINDYARRLANSEQEGRRMRDQLLAARKLEDWSRMSAVISHEISNPLESIQNILYLIQTGSGDPSETAALATQAEEEVRRVIEISRSTLSFHRESPRPEPVDLLVAARSVEFLLAALIQQKGIDFQVAGDGDLRVEAFPGETRQVILNLARNACEAVSEPRSVVRLTFTPSADSVELQVTDQGHGIDPRILSNLFEFGRSSKGDRGNGLGLWTVRQILVRHGGSVAIDPSYREGARFIVSWPRRYAGDATADAPLHGIPVPQTA